MPNPITKFFNKIDTVSLYGDYSKKVEWLEAIKRVPLYAKHIEVHPNNAEELENLTDPNLHNAPISNLQLKLLNSIKISAKTIENLQAIYPNSITISDNSITKGEFTKEVLFVNFAKLLSKLDQTSLELDFGKYYSGFELDFSDLIFKFVESKKECSYIRAKSVEIRCTAEDFCWIK